MSEPSRGSALRDFLLELLVVILGVLAALALSQWWQGREDARLVRRARSEFASETRQNREDLEDSAAYHASIPARVDSLMARVAPEDGRERSATAWALFPDPRERSLGERRGHRRPAPHASCRRLRALGGLL
ncbi:MAG: type II secretion system protein [Acidimicrobiia bacterium]